MFESVTFHAPDSGSDLLIQPALFCAPMDGLTHAPLRRLIAEFGGYGALVTEMISAHGLLFESIASSPHLKRRDTEGTVLYQLLLSGNEDVAAMVRQILTRDPAGLDLNLGCPAPAIRKKQSGMALFHDIGRLESVLATIRSLFRGVLTIKCRLGSDPESWQAPFLERLRLFERYQIGGLFVHPRFERDKLKRRVLWEVLSWIAGNTSIPVIANGDLLSPDQISASPALQPAAGVTGIMLGRIAAVQPWVFSHFRETLVGKMSGCTPPPIDYATTWQRLFDYIVEDFPPEKVLSRVKLFTRYYCRNFLFGHDLYRAVHNATTVDIARQNGLAFLSQSPMVCTHVSVAGI